jgi:hypothetical protein
VVLDQKAADRFQGTFFGQADGSRKPERGHAGWVRRSSVLIREEEIGGGLETTKARKLVRRHVEVGRTHGRIRAPREKCADDIKVTIVLREGDPELKGAAERGLPPVGGCNLVGVGSGSEEPFDLGVVPMVLSRLLCKRRFRIAAMPPLNPSI